jgi:hypothetical protein
VSEETKARTAKTGLILWGRQSRSEMTMETQSQTRSVSRRDSNDLLSKGGCGYRGEGLTRLAEGWEGSKAASSSARMVASTSCSEYPWELSPATQSQSEPLGQDAQEHSLSEDTRTGEEGSENMTVTEPSSTAEAVQNAKMACSSALGTTKNGLDRSASSSNDSSSEVRSVTDASSLAFSATDLVGALEHTQVATLTGQLLAKRRIPELGALVEAGERNLLLAQGDLDLV